MAGNRAEEFEIDANEYVQITLKGDILGAYHSHPTPAGFSEADIECSEETAIPFYLFDVQEDKWSEYLPSSYDPLLEGSRWILGFQDCFSVVRNYYRKFFKVYISDYDRDESFCHEEQGIIMSNFEKEGFMLVPKSDLREHDVILFRTDRALPQHFGIYLGRQNFLHHVQNAFCRQEILTENWMKRILYILRRKPAQVKCN